MKRYAIAKDNVSFAKMICKRDKINAVFHAAPCGHGYSMETDLTRGQFKSFLNEVLMLRRREMVPVVERDLLKDPKKLKKVSYSGKTHPERKAFRVLPETLFSVYAA